MEAMQIHASPWGECERPAVKVCLVVRAENATAAKQAVMSHRTPWRRYADHYPIRHPEWVKLRTRGWSVPRVPFTIWVRDRLVPRLRPGDIDSTISGRT